MVEGVLRDEIHKRKQKWWKEEEEHSTATRAATSELEYLYRKDTLINSW